MSLSKLIRTSDYPEQSPGLSYPMDGMGFGQWASVEELFPEAMSPVNRRGMISNNEMPISTTQQFLPWLLVGGAGLLLLMTRS